MRIPKRLKATNKSHPDEFPKNCPNREIHVPL